ncbi:LacI family DNA-binding transcriptional regulator [Nocardiopsis halotolerans]|uniref:LacI family DNA-binding transcriptional regulator n=1 Tax=Nocardiopsis halotolerans TaxID=124252 RepID=UPI000377C9EF|nr:LacI family DNA-binding transcriptional regulator [Nocardiopsis halotolerans]
MTEVTLREVARESGYSVATVSRVLSGTRAVGAQAERRVRAAAERLGYRPNQVARALRSRSTGTIGMVLPQITNPFFPMLVRAVEHELHSRGRALLIADCDDDPAVEADRVNALLNRQVDALLVIPVHEEHSRVAVAAAAERAPLVQLDRRCGTGVADTVAVDNAAGMALVLDHLARTGRGRPCFLGSAATDSAAVERRAAYEAGVAALDPEGASRVELGDFSVEWGRDAAERVWSERPDALVCANDLIAVGAIQQLRRMGVDVPGQVAVTGFDDVAIASLAEPALTTVRQPVTGLAEEAVRLLDQRLGEQGSRPRHAVRLAPELVARASTAPRTEEAQ